MARLPVVGETNWGPTLSEFLRVSHNEDGTLKTIIDVRDSGAVGNGTTDDTAALQAMFDVALDKTVLFGDNTKTYLVSKVTVRRGTRIIGRFCIQADNTVGGNSSIVILEEDVVADAVILKLRASSIVQRGVSVGNRCRVGLISVLAEEQAVSRDDNLDGMVQLRGDDIWVEQIRSRNCDYPVFAYECDRLTIGHVDIQSYVRGSLFRSVRNLSIDGYVCTGLSPNSAHLPGHNAILMSSVQNAVVKGVIAEDAGEHGIRIGEPYGFESEAITFVAPIFRRSGQCGFKANPLPGTMTGLTLVAPMIIDSASRSTPGTNEDGIRLEGVRRAHITSPTIAKLANGVSGYDGIYLNDCWDVVIDGPRISGVTRHGIHIEPLSGDVNSVFINNAAVSDCGSSGVKIQGHLGILRDITLMRAYIRLCGEYGVHCTTSGSTSGANQPVILDGWIKDAATGKLLSGDPDVLDFLTVL